MTVHCGGLTWIDMTLKLSDSGASMPPQVFNVPGRCFPVDVIHSQDDHMQDYAAAAVDTALQIHLQQPPGAQAKLIFIALMQHSFLAPVRHPRLAGRPV
jgi:hypothetical protein